MATALPHGSIAVLEGQTRPSFVRRALPQGRLDAASVRMVLLDCDPAVRQVRLTQGRSQPELASPRMDAWAAYLRGQADALDLVVIDTTQFTVDEVVDALVMQLRPNASSPPEA